jgi:hypothetical protein
VLQLQATYTVCVVSFFFSSSLVSPFSYSGRSVARQQLLATSLRLGNMAPLVARHSYAPELLLAKSGSGGLNRKNETAGGKYCGGGAEESKVGGDGAAATVAHAVKGGGGGSEFTTKAATQQGDSSEFLPSLCVVGLNKVAARARVLVHEVLDRGAEAIARGAARCASQVPNRGAQVDARGTAQVL